MPNRVRREVSLFSDVAGLAAARSSGDSKPHTFPSGYNIDVPHCHVGRDVSPRFAWLPVTPAGGRAPILSPRRDRLSLAWFPVTPVGGGLFIENPTHPKYTFCFSAARV